MLFWWFLHGWTRDSEKPASVYDCFPFYGLICSGMERLSNLPKAAQLLSAGVGIPRHKISQCFRCLKSEALNEFSWKNWWGAFRCLVVEESLYFVSWMNLGFAFLPCQFSKVFTLMYLYFFSSNLSLKWFLPSPTRGPHNPLEINHKITNV